MTVPEIKEAFKMYVAKEFEDVKVFRVLDCVAVGEVLNAFREYRNESLRVYDNKKKKLLEMSVLSKEQIKRNHEEFLKTIFDDLNETGFSSDCWLVYEALEKKGLITISSSEKKKLYEQQAQIYLIELVQETTTKFFHSAKFVIEEVRNKISTGKIIGSVANKCRSIVASEFLKDYLTDFEEFKKQIDGMERK